MPKHNSKLREKGSAAELLRQNGPPVRGDWPPAWGAAILLAVAIWCVFARASHAPFIFDDLPTVTKNPSIMRLWPLVGPVDAPGPLNPPPDLPTSGRPLVSLSFAINYYFGELDPVGYHVVNIALHTLSALLVWAIVRRTLRLPYFAGRYESAAGWLALAVAMLWALHPLQTEAVVYITQRTELMVSFFYLATLYCSLRYWDALPASAGSASTVQLVSEQSALGWSGWWLSFAVIACLCGMLSKEVMVSAPLIVLLFDRTFVAGSLNKALCRSLALYLGLAATWVALIAMNISAPRSASAGFSLGVSVVDWWLTQAKVLLMYFKLVIWPAPLLLYYDFPYVTTFGEGIIFAVPVLLLAGFVLFLLWRNRPVGFLGAFFFAILLPTIVVPIVTEMAAERRMYLPLLVPVVLFVVGGYSLTRWLKERSDGLGLIVPAGATVVILLAVVYGTASAKRLVTYDDETLLWREVIRDQPRNYVAHGNLGNLLLRANEYPESIRELQKALEIKPDHYTALNNLGIVFDHTGKYDEAIKALNECLKLKPDYTDAMQNLGNSLRAVGRFAEAKQQFEKALKLSPNDAEIHNNLGVLLASTDQTPQAIEQFRTALRLDPKLARAHINLGTSLSAIGEFQEAISELQLAVALQPERADLRNDLGFALLKNQQNDAAMEQFQLAVQLDPNLAVAYNNLALSCAVANRPSAALAASQRAIEVARATGQTDVAKAAEEWLAHYREELANSGSRAK